MLLQINYFPISLESRDPGIIHLQPKYVAMDKQKFMVKLFCDTNWLETTRFV